MFESHENEFVRNQYIDGTLKRFAQHHASFGLFERFVGKLGHSRSVSLMFDHPPFCIVIILVSQLPVTYNYNHRVFICDQLCNQVSLPFPRGIVLLH